MRKGSVSHTNLKIKQSVVFSTYFTVIIIIQLYYVLNVTIMCHLSVWLRHTQAAGVNAVGLCFSLLTSALALSVSVCSQCVRAEVRSDSAWTVKESSADLTSSSERLRHCSPLIISFSHEWLNTSLNVKYNGSLVRPALKHELSDIKLWFKFV